jgi:hypothetical protein
LRLDGGPGAKVLVMRGVLQGDAMGARTARAAASSEGFHGNQARQSPGGLGRYGR